MDMITLPDIFLVYECRVALCGSCLEVIYGMALVLIYLHITVSVLIYLHVLDVFKVFTVTVSIIEVQKIM
jgi:hypothetical protein